MITHLDDLDDDAVDTLAEETEKPKAVPVAVPLAKIPDPVDIALENLTLAVASQDVDAIGRAQEVLEEARSSALKAHQRRADLQKAPANVLKLAAEKSAAKALADKLEARLRSRAPIVSFTSGRKRIDVRLGGLNLEPAYSVECVKRLTHALSMASAAQIQATRNTGRTQPLASWLDPLLGDESHGIALYLRLKIAKLTIITKGKTKKGK